MASSKKIKKAIGSKEGWKGKEQEGRKSEWS